jgi:3-oxoacyl-[acyl-carrier protein] reductase
VVEKEIALKSLTNKVAVITGASSGIGRAIAERFALAGCAVVLAGRNQKKLADVAKEIEARRGRAHAVACDVTQEADVQHLVEEAVRRYGGLDYMINNAGVFHSKELANTTTDEYDTVVDTNLKGVYLGCREAFKVMKKAGGGHILNISSVAGKEAWAGLGLYGASKFAVMGLTQALADEGNPYGIKVTALCPGLVNTPMMAQTGVAADAMIQPDDVAASALYLVQLPKNVVIRELVMERKGAE